MNFLKLQKMQIISEDINLKLITGIAVLNKTIVLAEK